MKNLARNISLGINVFLSLLLATAATWTWRAQQTQVLTDTEPGHQLQRHVARYEAFINRRLLAERLVGTPFPKVRFTDITGRDVTTDTSNRLGGLFLLFAPRACQSCLVTQLKALQLLHSALKRPEALLIAAIANATEHELSRLTRAFRLSYPCVSDDSGLLLGTELGRHTPTVFLVDKHNTIVSSHIPTPGRSEFSVLYYNELRGKLAVAFGVDLDMSQTSFGLAGIPFLDVIRGQLPTRNANLNTLIY